MVSQLVYDSQQYLEKKNNIKYLCNNCYNDCTVVQIVLLSKSTTLPDENLQYVVEVAQSMSSDYHETNDKQNPLWRKRVDTVYCTPHST